MKKLTAVTLTLILPCLLVLLLTQTVASQPEPTDSIPINGLAYWATNPATGPDFAGIQLQPAPAHNPQRAVWAATQRQNQRHLDPAGLPENIQVSRSGTFTYASNPLNDFSEVMVAIDPTDPNHLLGSSKFFYNPALYAFYTGVFESYDGGLTWTQLQPDGVETYSLTSDPVNTFDELGNGYFTLLTRSPTGLDMLKKPVSGTWELPVVVDQTTLTDKQWIIADQDPQNISPHAGNVYMSWTDFNSPRSIVLSRSTDRNQTWSPVLSLAPGVVQGSMPGVAPDGTVYVVYGRNLSSSSGALEFVKSTDGGVTFSPPAVIVNVNPLPFLLPNSTFRSTTLPTFAVSPVNGDLYLAWADYAQGDADILFTSSSDSGASWSTPIRLNDDPIGNGVDQFQPQLAVAPNGRIAIMWFDRRLDCPDLPWILPANIGRSNYCLDTFMTRSFDNGQTWVFNLRASAQTWDWNLNMPDTGSGAGFIGDYQGMAASNDYDFPFWNATAELGNNPNNYQQVFVARMPVTTPAPPDLAASTKQVSPTAVLAGERLTYAIVLTNSGDFPTLNSLTDTLPISTTYVAGSLAAAAGTAIYTPTLNAVLWDGVVADTAITLTFQVTVSSQVISGTVVTNTAVFVHDQTLYQISAAASVYAAPQPPDLAASYKQASPTAVLAGERLTYTIMLTNSGELMAVTTLTDTLPISTTYVADSLTASSGTAIYSPTAQAILWNGAVTDTAITLTFQVTVSSQVISGTMVTNTAVLTHDQASYQISAAASVYVQPSGFKVYLPMVRRE